MSKKKDSIARSSDKASDLAKTPLPRAEQNEIDEKDLDQVSGGFIFCRSAVIICRTKG